MAKVRKVLELVCRSDGTASCSQNFEQTKEVNQTAVAKALAFIQGFCDRQDLDIVVHLKNREGKPLQVKFVDG